MVRLMSHVGGIRNLPTIAMNEKVIGFLININSVLHYFVWFNEHVSWDGILDQVRLPAGLLGPEGGLLITFSKDVVQDVTQGCCLFFDHSNRDCREVANGVR